LYKLIVRPVLFLFDPESVHSFAVFILKIIMGPAWLQKIFRSYYSVPSTKLEQTVFGIKFPNPVGLAAGFDKDAKLVGPLSALGFGFIEIGTLTPKAQRGNNKPRLFRLPLDQALINRMGFNNDGVDNAALRLRKNNTDIIIGGNIGKNKDTPNDVAYRDYEYSLEALFEVVDYFVVNVSSPNTPNLRELQEKEPLTLLLDRLMQILKSKPVYKPLLLKIAPDMSETQMADIVEIVIDTKIDGIIISNTTIDRDGLKTEVRKVEEIGPGGLSGKPLQSRSTEMIRYFRKNLGEKMPIIGVGGIFTADHVKEKLNAGANLVQVYTGFIYEGPGMVKKINQELQKIGLNH
jgi:dihydroorotate dehydrogenase